MKFIFNKQILYTIDKMNNLYTIDKTKTMQSFEKQKYFLNQVFHKKDKIQKNKKNQKNFVFSKKWSFHNFVDAVMNTTIGNFKLFCQKYKKVVLKKKVDFWKNKIKKL